jgi:hypothetical protein
MRKEKWEGEGFDAIFNSHQHQLTVKKYNKWWRMEASKKDEMFSGNVAVKSLSSMCLYMCKCKGNFLHDKELKLELFLMSFLFMHISEHSVKTKREEKKKGTVRRAIKIYQMHKSTENGYKNNFPTPTTFISIWKLKMLRLMVSSFSLTKKHQAS